MVRRLNTDGWKALPLVVIAAGGLVWHVLACVESPMTFAPSGDLAFVTMDPYGGKGESIPLRGARVYRLMVLPAGADQPRVLEESSDWMISAPAYSPDGTKVAYLRIPLLTAEELAKMEPVIKARLEAASQPASSAAEARWPAISDPSLPAGIESAGAAPGLTPSAEVADAFLPPADQSMLFYSVIVPAAPFVPVQLVERAAADGQIVSVSTFDLPLVWGSGTAGEGIAKSLFMTYVLGRPQYSPDGRWLYFSPGSEPPGSIVSAVDTETKNVRLMAVGAMASALSPDGKTLAVLHRGCLGFVRTDGSATSYVRCQTNVSPGGMVWAGNDALAILRADTVNDQKVHSLSFVQTDGTIASAITLPEMQTGGDEDSGRLALSPDGKHLVVSFFKGTYFLDSNGKLLGAWTGDDKQPLAQPTFTPDGTQVAFKVLVAGEKEEDGARVGAIAFFSPAGQEMRRVNLLPGAAVPPAPPPPGFAPEPVAPPAQPVPLPLVPPEESPRPLTDLRAPAGTVRPEPTTAPGLSPDQERAIDELRPELP